MKSKVETRKNKLITSFSTNHKTSPRSINTSLDKPAVLHQTKFDFNTLDSPERLANNPYKQQHEGGLIFKDFDSFLAKQQQLTSG